jgi:hypothetical protein
MLQIPIPDIRAVDHEHNRMTRSVVALPQLAQTVLAPNVPYLQVHIRQCNRRDILSYRRHSLEFGRGVGG